MHMVTKNMKTEHTTKPQDDEADDEQQSPTQPPVDTPEDHWERFKALARKAATTPKPGKLPPAVRATE
jgi:hypothetical protein